MPQEMQPTKPPSMRELHSELRATLGARRELGPELEETLVTNFLQQIERSIDQRVDARVTELVKRQKRMSGASVATVAISLGASIPLFGIAAGMQGVGGPIAVGSVCAMVVMVNILAFFRR